MTTDRLQTPEVWDQRLHWVLLTSSQLSPMRAVVCPHQMRATGSPKLQVSARAMTVRRHIWSGPLCLSPLCVIHLPGKGGQTTWTPSVAFRKSKEKLQSSLIGPGQPAAEKQPRLVLMDLLFEVKFCRRAKGSDKVALQQILSQRNASTESFCMLGELLEPTNPLGFRILCGDHFVWLSCYR